jgi:3-oxoacyl-[acyl-carrier protein] reductase
VLIGGLFGREPNQHFIVNSAVNAALAAFAKAASKEAAGRGIRINVVNPGAVAGRLWDETATRLGARLAISAEALNQSLIDGTPVGRLTTPQEVARAAVFLGAAPIPGLTGTSLVVDGGASATY